jgi:hypothetical protein
MYYLLHHSKGTLMLSADDRHQVIEWGKRQLGNQAGLISVIESDFAEIENLVEKDGTGIQAEETKGCIPMLSIMADSAQCLSELHKEKLHYSDSRVEFQMSVRKPTWH